MYFIYDQSHEHTWGATERAHFTGTPIRRCTYEGCRVVEVYFESEDG